MFYENYRFLQVARFLSGRLNLLLGSGIDIIIYMYNLKTHFDLSSTFTIITFLLYISLVSMSHATFYSCANFLFTSLALRKMCASYKLRAENDVTDKNTR